MTDIAIIPLALTVMLGPQILVGMLLITRKDPVKSSLIYILAVMLALVLSTYLYYTLARVFNFHTISIGGRPVIKHILIVVFVALIIRSIVNRKKITEPPKWMKGISTASLGKIFIIGFCLIALMPTDIAITLTIGNLLNTNASLFTEALPFFGAVLSIALLPLFIYFSLGQSGPEKLEKTNIWLNTHGYLINIIVLSFLIVLMI
ncbi:Sap-like sulfolipid-1-addressing protein [Winogradskyella wandonensis]|uniref:Sap-like sulfolipid-1-addressing protein n=1 Tax=Winogradskyella wandonensis TaxID=1442586 RepID=A0A4R1KUZ3_9FLAO|nr:GAP family protein [Winogradskyella wandonensis]TCK68988.1 Sap-like sulfolipid-1-addressing protein [Winogradskyella wandonensis]